MCAREYLKFILFELRSCNSKRKWFISCNGSSCTIRTFFKWVSKVKVNSVYFVLNCFALWLTNKTGATFLTNEKSKPIATCTPVFSRPLRRLHEIASTSDWFDNWIKGFLTRLFCCYGNLLRHIDDCILLSNYWSFIGCVFTTAVFSLNIPESGLFADFVKRLKNGTGFHG